MAKSLGAKVRARREQLRLTQEDLAELSGVSRNQIQNIEHSRNNSRDPRTSQLGRGNPRLDTVFALADALQVEVGELIDPTRGLSSADQST